jgi:hypothetical protein
VGCIKGGARRYFARFGAQASTRQANEISVYWGARTGEYGQLARSYGRNIGPAPRARGVV